MSKVDKKELGKGIRALLGDTAKRDVPIRDTSRNALTPVQEIEIDLIEINPFQPRNDFDEKMLQELADSIKTFGLIQPVTLRRLDGEKFQLIAGERRLRASKMAGLTSVPAFIRVANDQEMLEMALVENIQRAELNAIEVGISYQRLIDECSLTHEGLSDRIGKDRSTVTNYIRLLKLPPIVQQALKNSRITMGHARSLLGISQPEIQLLALNQILEEDLSVRSTEQLVRKLTEMDIDRRTKSSTPKLPVEYQYAVDHLTKNLGTRVELKRKSSGAGTLILHFHSDDDLNIILDRLDRND